MKQKLLLKAMLLLCALVAGSSSVWATTTTYQHVFSAKPSTGSNVTLSGVKWDISATNLGNYNSGNYAGVQIGTSSKNGSITLTSSSAWGTETGDYKDKTEITEVRLWLNLGGTSVTPSVTIGGKSATSDGTVVVKNSSAGSDWTKATKVTFTPASDGKTGVVVINVSTVKAGYICAMEIDCEESTGPITYSVTYNGNGATSGTAPTDATAYSSGDAVTVLGNTGSLAKTGYVFGGWNTQADGQGTNYSAGNTFSITASTTLYAKWNFAVTDGIFDFVEAAAAGLDYGSGVTTTSDGSTYVSEDKTWTAGNVTMVTSKVSGSGYRWWSADGTLRFYNESKATFSVPSGYVITQIVTTGANFDKVYGSNIGILSGSTWKGVSNEVALGATTGRNIKTITVTYSAIINPTYGWSTFVTPCVLDFTGLSDIKAYIVTGHSGSAITLEPMSGTVPANAPLLLKGVTANIPSAASSDTDVSDNLLKAGTGEDISAEGGKTRYVLGVEDGKATFLKIDAVAATVPVGKAYLEFNEVISAPTLSFDFGDANRINTLNVERETLNGEVYNLAGQRVANPTKGLYIVNGKKVIVK